MSTELATSLIIKLPDRPDAPVLTMQEAIDAMTPDQRAEFDRAIRVIVDALYRDNVAPPAGIDREAA